MNTAYVYKWTHIPTYKWYIGSRTAKNAHPDDGYICSSKIVKPMILSNPNEWKREILAIGTPQEMFEFETELLQLFDAKHDERSFNRHNNDGKPTTLGMKFSNEHREKIKEKRKLQVHTIESNEKRSKKLKGRKISIEQRMKISESNSRRKISNRVGNIIYKKCNCKFCNREISYNNLSRHENNCKYREVKK